MLGCLACKPGDKSELPALSANVSASPGKRKEIHVVSCSNRQDFGS